MKKLHFKKNNKLTFYIKSLVSTAVPRALHIIRRNKSIKNINAKQENYLHSRVDYYLKHKTAFSLSENAVQIKDYKLKGNSAYFFDLQRVLNSFSLTLKFSYLFGDVITIEDTATIVKSRPIADNNENSVIMKLDSVRHFNFINDKLSFSEKSNTAVWRGKVHEKHQLHRVTMFNELYENKFCDIGKTNKTGSISKWEKNELSIVEQLQHKFLLCVEGNDVATNLKWAMSSNSLCMMCKPVYETWFMEGKLEAGVHYVELKDDYSNFNEKVEYYIAHPDQAQKIIDNAHQHVMQFKDEKQELLISQLVLEKYFKLSGQC
ncbi:lipopolysaccharide A protein [Moritella sp. 24]|uniref:glycosyl transferase family 90 n=1 Tax=Moritella sp. 24 TaxID=2746230 RepID=UPI001BAA0707|nr:glycosyl transferase family 90 [Moritella sp. 24]QUM74923.1 lipopolysaccharide A protein [Moritella sp. 24]